MFIYIIWHFSVSAIVSIIIKREETRSCSHFKGPPHLRNRHTWQAVNCPRHERTKGGGRVRHTWRGQTAFDGANKTANGERKEPFFCFTPTDSWWEEKKADKGEGSGGGCFLSPPPVFLTCELGNSQDVKKIVWNTTRQHNISWVSFFSLKCGSASKKKTSTTLSHLLEWDRKGLTFWGSALF